ncbi:MAG: helix-turn-helix transcriptional regulator [Oscillospiraceae bacterium]|nr:helix-turn-helix transcriptional regulator [Oscillospiraceae bacterium]
MSPAQRLLRYRIKAAKRGLLSGNVSPSDLAEKCGFSSQSYFCYKFRQGTGMTSTQYRDEMLDRVKNE